MTRSISIILTLFTVVTAPTAANADEIIITTNMTIIDQPSHTFGDWIFELVEPSNAGFNLVDNTEDFIVSNSEFAGDFTLRRLDNTNFSLQEIRFGGPGSHFVGGVSLPAGLGSTVFQDFSFSEQGGVTNVSSVLFQPIDGFLQVSSLNVVSSIPEPGSFALCGLVLGMGAIRRLRR